jgi:hypothetical protein
MINYVTKRRQTLGHGAMAVDPPPSAISVYIIAKRREYLGHGATAADAAAGIPGIVIKGSANPNRIVVEGPPNQLQLLRDRMGQTFLVEPARLRSLSAI